MDISEFYKTYKSFVLEWINIKNNEYGDSFYINEDDFLSEVYTHLFVKPDKNGVLNIDKFNENHASSNYSDVEFKTTFEAWLSKVLWYLHIDLYRGTRKTKTITEIVDGEEKKTKISVKRFSNIDEMQNKMGDSFHPVEDNQISKDLKISESIKKIIFDINNNLNIKERVIIKLKLYIEDVIKFDDDELNFMMHHSKLSQAKLFSYISKNKKKYKTGQDNVNFFGMKNEHIIFLTGLASGSISTSYDRIVRKLNVKSYK